MDKFKKEQRSYIKGMEDRLFGIVGIMGEKLNDIGNRLSQLIPTAYYIES